MKKLHIAISTDDIAGTVQDYSQRLSAHPCVVIDGEYALWRTDTLNVSVRRDTSIQKGTVRHLGWEDTTATGFTADVDINDITWERFTADQQAEEINDLWPGTHYRP